MKRNRALCRQLLAIGDFPDGGWGTRPDGPTAARALSSGMSPLTETPRLAENAADAEIVIVETRTTLFAASIGWRPAINAYRCQDKFVIFVDLAGVPRDSIELQVDAGRLLIRGRRHAPEPDGADSGQCHLLALEIDQGSFERALDLPHAVNPGDVTTEYRDGLLRISIGLRT
jgi:HSP20 family molecular chaperone IbpA